MNADANNMLEHLRRGKLLHISTSSGERLHASAVWFALAEDGRTLFFTSRESRVHSDNIRSNGQVAASVVSIELEGLGQKTQGVFMTGRATEVAGRELTDAYETYAGRWPQVRQMFSEDDVVQGRTPMRMYALEVDNYIWLDEVGHPDSPRLEFGPNDLAD